MSNASAPGWRCAGAFSLRAAEPSATTSSAVGTPANNVLIGEVALPAVANTVVAATPDVVYPLNIAIPAGYKLYAGEAARLLGIS